jgi:hypothetical protein
MTTAPRLTRAEIARELGDLYQKGRHHHLFAFYGTGDEDVVEIPQQGRVDIQPVRSELDLRAKMPPLDDEGRRIVFLVPWRQHELPLDLAGRFALRGEIRPIGKETRLRSLFGVMDIDDSIVGCPLVDHLLKSGDARQYPVQGGRLTLDRLWEVWLRTDWSVEVEGGLSLDQLLGWAATHLGGAKFTEAMQGDEAQPIRKALLVHLRRTVGPAGPVVWAAWERGQGRATLVAALLLEVLAQAESPAVRMWLRQMLKHDLPVTDEEDLEGLGPSLGKVASAALRVFRKRTGEKDERALLAEADQRVDEPEVRVALAESNQLPSAWAARLTGLGKVLKQAATNPTAESAKDAAQWLGRLEKHSFFKDRDQKLVFERAEMATRLLAWLAGRPAERFEEANTTYGDVESLGRFQAEEGGYLDWARHAARGLAVDELGQGVYAVTSAVDAVRLALDRRFARALREWVIAGRPSGRVIPIDQALRRIGVKLLSEDPERRLLVLLLDGMSWAQTAELLGSLAERTITWGPIAWHARPGAGLGEGSYPVVLAALPTVTEVSRSAFFAGKPIPAGAALDPGRDPDRFKANKDVLPFFPGQDAPRLLLRADVEQSDGSVTPEALNLVANPDRRVVALVVNAIDASLSSDPQIRHEWSVETIKPLAALLDRAAEAGRVVLLCSDHGHVPSDCLTGIGTPAGAKPRYRPWKLPGEPLADYELGFTADQAWAAKGDHGVVVITDEAHRYGGGTGSGEHGGATLAEVVTPCLLLAREDLAAMTGDQEVETRPRYLPPWWHFEVTRFRIVESVPRRAPAVRKETPEPQLALLDLLPPHPAPAGKVVPVEPDRTPVAVALEKNALLKAQVPDAGRRKKVLDAVDYLIRHDNVASEKSFAEAMREPVRRVGGLVSLISESLNLDGYEVLSHDAANRQVSLNVAALKSQFEVDG